MGLRFFSIANLAIAGGGKQEVELHDFLFMFMTVNQGDLRNLLLHVRCLMNFQGWWVTILGHSAFKISCLE